MDGIKKEKEFMCPLCSDDDNQITDDSYLEDDYYVYKMICGECEIIIPCIMQKL